MGNSYKAILGIALAMPVLAYVAGALVAANAPVPERAPIILVQPGGAAAGGPSNSPPDEAPDTAAGEAGTTPGTGPTTEAPQEPTPPPKRNEPQVVKPRPSDLDDDGDDPDDDDPDDDSAISRDGDD